MNYILLEKPKIRDNRINPFVIYISDQSVELAENDRSLLELAFDVIPEGCEINADGIQDADGNWTFSSSDFRTAATNQIHEGHQFDDKNFDELYEMTDCMLEAFKALHVVQVSDSPAAERLHHCVIKLQEIKERMDLRKEVNDTLHAIIGDESSKGSRSLLGVARFIKEAITLVNNVSEAYGFEGLALLKAYFSSSQHFDEHGKVSLPSASVFNPELWSGETQSPEPNPAPTEPAPTEPAPPEAGATEDAPEALPAKKGK